MLTTERYLRFNAPKLYSRELMDVLFTQPYCRIANLVDRDIAKRQAASSYLKALVDLEILAEIKVGREKLFLHKKFHELLTVICACAAARDIHSFTPLCGSATLAAEVA